MTDFDVPSQDPLWFSGRDTDGVRGLGQPLGKLRECVECRHQTGRYGGGFIYSPCWNVCRECGLLAWASAKPCSVPHPHSSITSDPRLRAHQICVACTGADGERAEELMAKYDPDLAVQRRQARHLQIARRRREAWLASSPIPQPRVPDMLASVLAAGELTNLFEIEP